MTQEGALRPTPIHSSITTHLGGLRQGSAEKMTPDAVSQAKSMVPGFSLLKPGAPRVCESVHVSQADPQATPSRACFADIGAVA